jgi:hypothetical protein
MDIDLTLALSVLVLSALILHYKSHVKFVAMGAFVGFVLLDVIPIQGSITNPILLSLAQIAILLLPAVVLGINHTVDKRKGSLLWTGAFVLVFTLFFLSSLVQFLPGMVQTLIREQSVIGWRILSYFQWYTLAAAVLLLADSIPHRHHVEKEKKKKKSSSKKGSTDSP